MAEGIEFRDGWRSEQRGGRASDAGPGSTIEYRGVTYQPEIAAKLDVVLRASDGTLRACGSVSDQGLTATHSDFAGDHVSS